MTTQSYGDFLAAKVRIAERTGFDIALDEINPALKDHTLLQLFDAARDEPVAAREHVPVPRKSAPDPGVSAPTLGELKALLDRMSPEELRQSWYGWDDGCLYAGDDLVIDPEGRAAA